MIDPNSPDFENTPASSRRPRFGYALADPQAPPEITIVTPFYNEAVVFHETAQSIIRQSFQQWEWIIVNDASTDANSLTVLAGYRTIDDRIRIVDNPVNQGPSAARNLAFRMARAPNVVHLDSDNLLEPTALEKWLWYLESRPECSFVKGFTVGFGAETHLWRDGFHQGRAFLTANRVDMTSMIRRDVHRTVGGFDESLREGLEDWEFWLRCADAGFWGGTLPEYLDWYRRRSSHADRWKAWDGGRKQHEFGLGLRRRFPKLWNGGFPEIRQPEHIPFATLRDDLPCDNVLAKRTRRILMILPWLMMGGSDKFTLDLVEQLSKQGWEITIATTLDGANTWEAEFRHYTPDVFLLHRFVSLTDVPRFLRYLVRSRQVDVVFVSHSELGYQLLPYLRAHFPHVTFLDFCHIEERWKNGGYPRLAVEAQELLDLNVVSSRHLKEWMVGRGADAERIEVSYTGIDTDMWRPDATVRGTVRAELGVDDAVPVILYAGRICEQKQPRVFAGAILQLRRRNIRFLALVAGDGPELPSLRRSIEKQGLGSSVRFLGAASTQRMNELMKAADIFFLPSAWEGIAVSIYEAMASSVAVVGANVGGQQELVTPDCGILIERSDQQRETDVYAAVLADLARDPVRRCTMGTAARERVVAGFSLKQMGQIMADQIDRATWLHDAKPRPTPGLGLGRACAAQAVELTRASAAFDKLWHAWRAGGVLGVGVAALQRPGWRERVYEVCRVLYEPFYRRGIERGGAWYFGIANRIKAVLLRTTYNVRP